MSKSAILSSSIAKKYWMALTGLFLCLFLVGHLLGNLQLFASGNEGKLAFNQYAYFMTHNPLIKVLSYLTYLSIIFHAIDGIMLAFQNKKARPVPYAKNNAAANSKLPARKMALLGSIILIFIILHMNSFWGEMHFGNVPLQTISVKDPQSGVEQELYVTKTENYLPKMAFETSQNGPAQMEIKNGTEFYNKSVDIKMGEGYKDLYSLTLAFFGKGTKEIPANKNALIAVIAYVISMIVLSFHLMHGFSSSFQTLGINHKKYTPGIKAFGKVFSIVVPFLFALIPLYIYFTR